MMQEFKWSQEYQTGQTGIDQEHRELVDSIISLRICLHENDFSKLSQRLENLKTVAEIHFKNEEKEMADGSYPKISIHIKEHHMMLEIIQKLKKTIENNKQQSTLIINEMINDIVLCLHGHFLHADKEFINFISKK